MTDTPQRRNAEPPEPTGTVPAPTAADDGPHQGGLAGTNAAPARSNRKRNLKELQTVRNLWIVIGGLTFVLIITMLLRPSPPPPPPAASSNPATDYAVIRAELEMSLAEINRQRAEMGHPPLPSGTAGPSEITARLRQDAETLVALIDRYQRMISEKNREITEKNIEIIRAGQRNEELSIELEAARSAPAGDSGAAAQLEAELTEVLARSNRLADELAAARSQLAEMEANPPSDEVDILTRRLEEAKRARDFFEQRALQLEEAFNSIPDGVEIDNAEDEE